MDDKQAYEVMRTIVLLLQRIKHQFLQGEHSLRGFPKARRWLRDFRDVQWVVGNGANGEGGR